MGEGRSHNNRSLTGVWQGIYNYPLAALPTVAFTATLIEAGSSLSGSVHEVCIMDGKTLFFSLNGSRHGASVDFVKTFDGKSSRYGAIVYQGAVNDDATEIEGRWTVPGDWSGRFLMTRSGESVRAAVEREGVEAGAEVTVPTPSR